jgi:hypothetical protein
LIDRIERCPYSLVRAAPDFSVDLVDGEQTYIYGITLGVGF